MINEVFPRYFCRGFIEACSFFYSFSSSSFLFRGTFAAASLKLHPHTLFRDLWPRFPRYFCRGFIEARVNTLLNRPLQVFPRYFCRGFIEAKHAPTGHCVRCQIFRGTFAAASLKHVRS